MQRCGCIFTTAYAFKCAAICVRNVNAGCRYVRARHEEELQWSVSDEDLMPYANGIDFSLNRMQHVHSVTHDRRQQRLDGVLYILAFTQAPPPPLCRYHIEPPVAVHSLNDFTALLQGARQLEVMVRFAKGGRRDKYAEERLQALAEVVADGQHHDAITGRSTVLPALQPLFLLIKSRHQHAASPEENIITIKRAA